MVELLFVLFVMELSLFLVVDYYKYNTIFTPVLFLGVPFALVLALAVFLCSHIGFLPVSEYAIVIWCAGLFLFWFPGSLLTFATIKNKIVLRYINFGIDDYTVNIIRYSSWCFILVLLMSFARSYLVHGTIGGDGFSEDFASHGLAAHCLSLLKFNVAFLVCVTDKKRYQDTLVFILTFVFLFLYNVKGGIILTALVCLFSRTIILRSTFKIRQMVLLVLVGVGFFAISYLISLGSINLNFITFHFLAYVVAGIVGLSEHLRQGLPIDTDVFLIVQPVKNIILFITGENVSSILSDFWVTTSTVYAKKSNVKTFFGDIYIYAGLIKGVLATIFFGMGCYLTFIFTIKFRNVTCLVVYLFFISSLMLGWFSLYFNFLFYYEIVVYALFVTGIGRLLRLLFGRSNA